jgi:hypothetical protein
MYLQVYRVLEIVLHCGGTLLLIFIHLVMNITSRMLCMINYNF